MFYMGLPLKTVWKLWLVQTAVTRQLSLTEARYKGHIAYLLQYLHWLLVHFQAQFKVLLIITYIAIYSLGSDSI